MTDRGNEHDHTRCEFDLGKLAKPRSRAPATKDNEMEESSERDDWTISACSSVSWGSAWAIGFCGLGGCCAVRSVVTSLVSNDAAIHTSATSSPSLATRE